MESEIGVASLPFPTTCLLLLLVLTVKARN